MQLDRIARGQRVAGELRRTGCPHYPRRYTAMLPPGPAPFDRGLDLDARRPDKSWSLTDYISFVVMADRGRNGALTGDPHFEQAGFRTPLK